MKKTTSWCSALLTCLLLASPAGAVTQEGALGGGDEDEGLGLAGMVTLDNSVGIGSFYRSDTSLFLPALILRAAWTLPGTENVTLNGRLDLELYSFANLDAYTDRDPDEAVRPADLMLTLAHGKLFEDEWVTGLEVSGSLRFYLPTSPASQLATSILGVGPRLGLSRKFGFLTLSGGTRGVYRFLRYDNTVIEPEDTDEEAIQGCIPRLATSGASAERGDVHVCGGTQNWDRRFIHDMNAGFQITKSLSLTLTLFIINSWGVERPIDEYTSEVTKRTNNENQRDLTWGIVDLTYDVNQHLSLSVGTSSLQNSLTSDGERLRFPWWDLEGPQANRTSLYVDITGSF